MSTLSRKQRCNISEVLEFVHVRQYCLTITRYQMYLGVYIYINSVLYHDF